MAETFYLNRDPGHIRYIETVRGGLRTKWSVRLVDESGAPIPDMPVRIVFMRMSASHDVRDGRTNSDGVFTATGRTETKVAILTTAENWYRSVRTDRLLHDQDYSNIDGDRWLPWNPTNTLVVRPKQNPVPMIAPMYEAYFGRHSDIPLDTVLGFDCKEYDYLPPFGKGKTADFTVEITSAVNGTNELRLAAAEEGGGFVVRPVVRTDSWFVTDYEAPEDGYSPTFVLREPTLTPEDYAACRWTHDWCSREEPQYVIFRSRVRRDASGAVTNATHGIFFGDFHKSEPGRWWVDYPAHESISWSADDSGQKTNGYLRIDYRFNPDPTSRSIEWNQYEYRHR